MYYPDRKLVIDLNTKYTNLLLSIMLMLFVF